MSQKILISLLFLFALFQLFSLQIPRLSGDEAIAGVLIYENFQYLLAGHGIQLNPALSYLGPMDLWILGFPSLLIHKIQSIEANAGMIRIMPLLFYWGAIGYCCCELRQHSKVLRTIYLVLAVVTPVAAMSARIGWAPALLMGSLTLAWTELLYAERTGVVRWLQLSLFLGLSIEFHPTTWIAAAILFASAPRLFWKNTRLKRKQFLAALCLGFVLIYPEIRNFPPPVTRGEVKHISRVSEIQGISEIISGVRSYEFLFSKKTFPLLASYLITSLVIFLLCSYWFQLTREKRRSSSFELKRDGMLLRHLQVLLFGTLALLWFCYRYHSMGVHGYERYLIEVTPAWILVFSESLHFIFLKFNPKFEEIPSGIYVTLACLCVISLSQFFYATQTILGARDPYFLAAKWLEKKCPIENCLAYAEDYWTYWPIRFYTKDKIEVNSIQGMWAAHPEFEARGRRLAACYHSDSNLKQPIFDLWLEKEVFEGGDNRNGVVCYLQQEKASGVSSTNVRG